MGCASAPRTTRRRLEHRCPRRPNAAPAPEISRHRRRTWISRSSISPRAGPSLRAPLGACREGCRALRARRATTRGGRRDVPSKRTRSRVGFARHERGAGPLGVHAVLAREAPRRTRRATVDLPPSAALPRGHRCRGAELILPATVSASAGASMQHACRRVRVVSPTIRASRRAEAPRRRSTPARRIREARAAAQRRRLR